MHGYRVGYIAGSKVAIRRMANIQAHLTASVNEVGQHAALAALTGPQNWIEQAVNEYEKRRNFLVSELNRIDGVRCQKPDGGMFVFPSIKEYGKSSFELMRYLLEEVRVWVHPGSPNFGRNAEGYLRLAFTRSRRMLEEGLERMRNALEKL